MDRTTLPLDAATHQILEFTGLACFEVDARRDVVWVSPEMERLTGFRAEDVVGRSCLTLHRCAACLKGRTVFERGEVRDETVELHTADGSVARVKKSGRVFRDTEGRPAGALEFVRPLAAPGAEGSEEAAQIRDALERARYRRTEAARILGISRTTLWRKMREYGL